MNYWLTAHWPPHEDRTLDESISSLWLPDGREEAGADFGPGDSVLVYQSKTGRTEVRKRADGSTERIRRTEGKEGIVAVTRARSSIHEVEDSAPTTYSDGTTLWWRWHALLEPIAKSGFVPREVMNPVLGYSPSYSMRGFGDGHSGLKRITEEQYLELVDIFRRNIGPIAIPDPLHFPTSHRFGGTGEESEAHRLLKEYVASKPDIVLSESGLETVKIEWPFVTGDRADIVIQDQTGRIVGVEIEVNIQPGDPTGVLQAIKYRYMLEPVTNRAAGDSRAFLVAYSIPADLKLLCERYGVECFEIPKSSVEEWRKELL